jgi:5-methylcytosine-specific restriction endonuclease McrA
MRIKVVNEKKEKDIEWSRLVKERDGFKCVVCGSTFRPNAHHIIPREVEMFRHLVDNGLTLCVAHHKFNRVISAHQAPFAFHQWLLRNRPELYERCVERTNTILRGFL